ncbi:MAG: hypothetical protein LUE91_04465, partial [Oscillospiraceae bacterium]|nr:hypothetical protein [Oscillospiraceae bacterium]
VFPIAMGGVAEFVQLISGFLNGIERNHTDYHCDFAVRRHDSGGQPGDEVDYQSQSQTGRVLQARKRAISPPGEMNPAAARAESKSNTVKGDTDLSRAALEPPAAAGEGS